MTRIPTSQIRLVRRERRHRHIRPTVESQSRETPSANELRDTGSMDPQPPRGRRVSKNRRVQTETSFQTEDRESGTPSRKNSPTAVINQPKFSPQRQVLKQQFPPFLVTQSHSPPLRKLYNSIAHSLYICEALITNSSPAQNDPLTEPPTAHQHPGRPATATNNDQHSTAARSIPP